MPNFFPHIKLSKCAYFWRFSHINVTSDSDSIKVIIMPLMAEIHCDSLDSIFLSWVHLIFAATSKEFSNL